MMDFGRLNIEDFLFGSNQQVDEIYLGTIVEPVWKRQPEDIEIIFDKFGMYKQATQMIIS